ncbi:DNA polymerase-3 subunit beta [Allocatelliglobosispora scoriae]|uniref:DNA polymerase-3 subunit beta n=1 Tax=Allocatelliglobosispora scoriae TaxID=643052 RepID=A0A841C5Z7_9ACTN|nr:DNA polymerase III subunit beta [Allocatelliglobosispora scoriae]MBB5874502.1 DNA polymerase-3 subunit beta [Allocatelliglobosispora scoriae]
MQTTVVTARLAEAAALLVRLMPGRPAFAAHAGVLLTADDDGIELAATDGELTARVRVPGFGHEPGAALVSRRGFAATTAAIDSAEIRLMAEGSRLAVRTPNARFALPLLDRVGYTPPAQPPAVVGTIDGGLLRSAAVPVAGAASQKDALPIFTAVRVRSEGDRLELVATDRFRMAMAAPAWSPAAPAGVDALVPAGFLAEAARQAAGSGDVAIHADGDRFGFSFGGISVFGHVLAQAFPDDQVRRLFLAEPEAEAGLDAGELAGAVERAALYAGARGRVSLQLGGGVIMVRGSDEQAGESEESVKATVRGGLISRTYQARYLLDALRGFTGGPVVLRMQAGIRPTVFARPEGADPRELRYLVVPLRLARDE